MHLTIAVGREQDVAEISAAENQDVALFLWRESLSQTHRGRVADREVVNPGDRVAWGQHCDGGLCGMVRLLKFRPESLVELNFRGRGRKGVAELRKNSQSRGK